MMIRNHCNPWERQSFAEYSLGTTDLDVTSGFQDGSYSLRSLVNIVVCRKNYQ